MQWWQNGCHCSLQGWQSWRSLLGKPPQHKGRTQISSSEIAGTGQCGPRIGSGKEVSIWWPPLSWTHPHLGAELFTLCLIGFLFCSPLSPHNLFPPSLPPSHFTSVHPVPAPLLTYSTCLSRSQWRCCCAGPIISLAGVSVLPEYVSRLLWGS